MSKARCYPNLPKKGSHGFFEVHALKTGLGPGLTLVCWLRCWRVEFGVVVGCHRRKFLQYILKAMFLQTKSQRLFSFRVTSHDLIATAQQVAHDTIGPVLHPDMPGEAPAGLHSDTIV